MLTRAGVVLLDELRMKQGLDPKKPWGGRSPRVLTKAYIKFTLRRATSTVEEGGDDE